jgi:hypothetical protein
MYGYMYSEAERGADQPGPGELTDYSKANILGPWYKSVNFGAGKDQPGPGARAIRAVHACARLLPQRRPHHLPPGG